ncbi:hypothetical protein ASE12_14895 [Aeromicrobium sp. Root236]|uniref:hypothetical protein n=1 Tax=Aeromicrobium sp. Root236 TaxID=1736498 RepID=UPI0006FF8E9E|nr:hypothetical protein [Aeromicrobium sp. Root236]KRC65933.1 hypothetical protein ASE12_14895 [Aeromicrobium sp. Root236]
MKWLVIIAIIVIVVIGILWLRTVRQGPDTVDSQRPHRLDDSVAPSGDADNPLPPGGQAVAGGATGGPPIDPPSSATWATEEAGPSESGPGEDLPPSETHPNA